MRIIILLHILVLSFGGLVNRNNFTLYQLSSINPLTHGNFLGFQMTLPTDGQISLFQSQLYDSNGKKINDPITITSNFAEISDTVNSRMTNSAGLFMKAWASRPSLTDNVRYFGMIFNSDGVNVTDVFPIASQCGSDTLARSSRTYYTNINDNSFVFVWTSYCGQHAQVMAQIIGPDGVLKGSQITVTGSTSADNAFSVCFTDVASLSLGGFVVVYEARFTLDYDSIVYAQKFNENGERLGTPVQVVKPTSTAFPCNLGPFNSRGNILGVVGLNNGKMVVFSAFDGHLVISAWDTVNMKKVKNNVVDTLPRAWSYDSLFYTVLDDQSIVITGCCANAESYTDLWLIRMSETELLEFSELDLDLSQPFFYFIALHTNTVIFMYNDINSQSNIEEIGLLVEFNDNYGTNTDSSSFLGDNKKTQVTVGVVVTVLGVLFLALLFCGIKRWRGKRKGNTYMQPVESNEVIGSEVHIESK